MTHSTNMDDNKKPDPIFPAGIGYSPPREEAPEFIKGTIGINPKMLLEWCKTQREHINEKGWMNLDLKKSQKGTLYLQLNTWKPTPRKDTVDADFDAIDKNEPHPGDEIPF